MERKIDHPTMRGYREYTVPVPVPELHRHEARDGKKETDVSLGGYYHHFGPALAHKTVGTYEEPAIAHSRPSALKAGLLTVGAGLAVGLLAALVGGKD